MPPGMKMNELQLHFGSALREKNQVADDYIEYIIFIVQG